MPAHFPRSAWDGVESRLDHGMDAILDCLARHDAHATMFFLGWVAERRPDLVARCVDLAAFQQLETAPQRHLELRRPLFTVCVVHAPP